MKFNKDEVADKQSSWINWWTLYSDSEQAEAKLMYRVVKKSHMYGQLQWKKQEKHNRRHGTMNMEIQ